MSARILLISTVLMIPGLINFVQAGVVCRMNYPPLDLETLLGTWYLIGSSNEMDQNICMTNVVVKNSETNLTMEMMRALHSDAIETNASLSDELYRLTLYFITTNDSTLQVGGLKGNSNLVADESNAPKIVVTTMRNRLYDVYLVIYTDSYAANVINNSDKLVFIFSREKTWNDVAVDGIQNSDPYRDNINPGKKLFYVDPGRCNT